METNENENNCPKSLGCNKSCSKWEVLAVQAYLKKQEKSQINNITLHVKDLEKEEQSPKLP